MRGDRIQLATDMESLGTSAHKGDQGTVTGVHAGGYLTVRMDDGRTQFPRTTEVDVLPDDS